MDIKNTLFFIIICLNITSLVFLLLAYRNIDFAFNLFILEDYENIEISQKYCDIAVFSKRCFSVKEIYSIGLSFFAIALYLIFVSSMLLLYLLYLYISKKYE